MAATVVWIGGLFFQAVVLAPALARGVPKEAQSSLRETLQRRFEPLAWLSLAVLVATGLTQMIGNQNYKGLLAIDNQWSSAILAKHLVIALMVVIASYQTWILHPRIAHLALRQAHRLDTAPEDTSRLLRHQTNLMRLNFSLGLLVLALTAIARTA
jgi:uncharacterized membrane protein